MQPPLPANLRRALSESEMTQEALARAADCSLRSVAGWCLGDALPRWPQLVRIAGVLGKEPGWFYVEHGYAAESAEQAA